MTQPCRTPAPIVRPVEREPTCAKCGGRVIVVGHRWWCVKPYADGGCGRSGTGRFMTTKEAE